MSDAGQPHGTPSGQLRVVACDDHPLVLEGILHGVCRVAPEVRLLGTAQSTAQLLTLLAELPERPDVLLVDLHLRDGSDPAQRVADLTAAGHRVVVVTSEDRPVMVRRAVRAGAVGLVLKSDPVDALVEVIRTAAAGDFAVSGDLAHALVTDPDLAAALAPREVEVLSLLADGVSRKTVGAHMDPPVASTTAVTYLNRAIARYRELGWDVQSAADAVRAALADGHLIADRFGRD